MPDANLPTPAERARALLARDFELEEPDAYHAELRGVLNDLKDQGAFEAEPAGRAVLQEQARRVAEALFRTTLEYPSAAIRPFAGDTPSLQFQKSQKIVGTSRLPRTSGNLFGREQELANLEEAWQDKTIHILSIVAWGGVGKTSLVARWMAGLAARNFDGADYFDWSFYSQGTRDQTTASADAFVDAALRFFGDEKMADSQQGPWDKGARLAQLVGERKSLLVLDGLEPLQHPPGPMAGELKDPAIQALLRGLALRNAGLCLVTTREPVAELAPYVGQVAQQWRLDRLSTAAGVALLKALKIDGSTAELQAAVEEVDGHALTLNLVGRYVARALDGDIRKRDRVNLQKADENGQSHGHAFRAMATYEHWLTAGGEEDHLRQLAILRLLGLFDRPAPANCLAVLRAEPAIAGLTEKILELGEEDWNSLVSDLAEAHLVVHDGESLDAHPLIREYFASRLRESGDAWQEAHGRLFDFLRDYTDYQPDTLAGLQPLYQAVYHGCQAGRQQETCDGVYRKSILRGNDYYSTKKLGAFGAELGVVACFFATPWSDISKALRPEDQTWLMNQAAFCLRALGRLTEALEPLGSALTASVAAQDWKSAARLGNSLSELKLALGDLPGAIADARRAVTFANRSGDKSEQLNRRATLADVKHQAGDRAAAAELFRDAERRQAELEPEFPALYSLRGFRYCDFLMAAAEQEAGRGGGCDQPYLLNLCEEAERRASTALADSAKTFGTAVLDFALDRLTQGRARLYRSILEGSHAKDVLEARTMVEKAVTALRAAGDVNHLPLGLLTEAWVRFVCGDEEGARADLDETWEIADRGSMRLYLADVALYRARFFGDMAALAEARSLVTECGYGRRLPEIEDLEARLA